MRALLLFGLGLLAGCGATPSPTEPTNEPAAPVVAAGDDPQPAPRPPAGRLVAPAGLFRSGDAVVKVISAELDGDHLLVVLGTKTTNPAGKLKVGSWENGARAVTDTGEVVRVVPLPAYVRTRFEIATGGADAVGFGPGVAVAGRGRGHVLALERPTPVTAYIDLDLDGNTVGAAEPVRFRIPATLWKNKR